MSSPNLILAFDVANHVLVPFQGSSSDLPTFRQTRYNARIYLVTQLPASTFITQSYATIDYSQYDSLRMGIWSASTFTLGDADAALLALTDQLGWTLTADSNGYQCFEGIFNCNTTEIAALGSGNSSAGYLAINLTKGTDLVVIADQSGTRNCTIYSATDEFSGVTISVTGAASRLTLPLELYNPATGHIFALTETSSGVVEWVWTNP